MSEDLLRYSRLVSCAITDKYMDYYKESKELLKLSKEKIDFLKSNDVSEDTSNRESKNIEELHNRIEWLATKMDVLTDLRELFDGIAIKMLKESKEAESVTYKNSTLFRGRS